ncbi:hypothetical protein SAMN04487996_11375 [Dyadobacter soli]|uniref:Uncharacterized protein n=1 Tax=Dyadobacter soli TaxID=659014 RepID=A0A1G7PNV1_9BACT|nr:hypothetical protein [Dyadobacter soli]SDF87886.1 hypothetical protein SAMN04487996_11375 [Dyadobacter soli]
MKKVMITAVIALLCAASASYAQSTTSSTDKSKTTKATGQGIKTPTPETEKKSPGPSDKPNPTDQVAQKSSEGDGSNRPGGATHENANDVGRYSEQAHANSMLFSKEAIEIRRKNLTETDNSVKEGSGSSPRNTKNHTGTTGNYRNLATQTSGTPSAE